MRALVATLLGFGLLALGAPGRADAPHGKRYVVAAVGDSLTDTRSGGTPHRSSSEFFRVGS
jgi:hypothetical protein